MDSYHVSAVDEVAQSLLLFLHSNRAVFLESSIGNLKATESIDANVKNHHEQERGDKAHENTCFQIRTVASD